MIAIQSAISPQVRRLLSGFASSIIEQRPPTEVIERNNSLYIDRWHLARKAIVPKHVDPYAAVEAIGQIASELENLYLHRYHRADRDEPHDHPWPNASLVLSGWYREDVYRDGRYVGWFHRPPGMLVLRESGAVHAITEVAEGTISLFATLPKERAWGFLIDGRIMPWREHKALREGRSAQTSEGLVAAPSVTEAR